MKGQGFAVRTNGIFGFIFLVLVLVAIFFIAKGIFKLLALAAPVLIIGALIINYRTILNYFKFILSLLRRNPLGGIIAILLSIIGFPVLAFVLFGKAILDRKVRRLQREHRAQEEGEYVPYEEVIRDKRDADLYGRQELAWIQRQIERGARAPAAGPRHRLQPGLARGDNRQLRHRERAVERDQRQDDREVGPGKRRDGGSGRHGGVALYWRDSVKSTTARSAGVQAGAGTMASERRF